MNSSKKYKIEQKIVGLQKGVIGELQELAHDIERCEQTIQKLKAEMEAVNAKHANRKTTQDDIHFLEDLLACARKKLVWEKQMASLQKRTPVLMDKIVELVNHPQSCPDEQTKNALMQSLHNVQESMKRLNEARL